MKTTVAQVLIFSMIMLGHTGCTTMADSIQARGKNPQIVYQISHAELWEAFPDIVVAAGLKFVSANREDNTVLAQKGITPFSWGENVAIFVEKIGEDKACPGAQLDKTNPRAVGPTLQTSLDNGYSDRADPRRNRPLVCSARMHLGLTL